MTINDAPWNKLVQLVKLADAMRKAIATCAAERTPDNKAALAAAMIAFDQERARWV
jgi:hypothetical protein